MPPKPLKDPKRRKAMIYAGLAAAMLLLVVFMRRSSSASSTAAAQPTAQPVSNPAVDPNSYYSNPTGTGAGGVDYGPQLATLDTDIQTLAQAVAANQTNAQTPGSSTPGTTGTTTGTDVASIFAAAAASETAGASIYQAGQGSVPAPAPVTVNVTAPKQAGPGSRPPVTKPPAPKLPTGDVRAPSGAKKPAAPAGYTAVGLGSGNWAFKPVKGPGNRKK